MSEVLIVQPPLRTPLEFVDYPYLVGLGVYQAAAVLRAQGWTISLLDAFTMQDADLRSNGHSAWVGAPRTAFLRALRAVRARVVLVNASPFLLATHAREWLAEILTVLRMQNDRVIVLADLYQGGMHYVEYLPSELLSTLPSIDALLRYECEPLLVRLSDIVERPRGTGPLVLENRDPFALDDLPEPAFDLLEAERFFAFLRRALSANWRPGPFPAIPERTLPISTARGCPYGCVFCTKNPGLPEPRRQHRSLSLTNIESRLQRWQADLGLQRVVLLDEIANFPQQRFDGLLTIFERLGLRVEIPNGLRADLLTEHQVQRLSGVTSRLKVSMESASKSTQSQLLGKQLDPATVERVARWCQESGLGLDIHYLVGIPGEPSEDLRKTLDIALRLEIQYGATPLPQLPVPIPGSTMERELRQASWMPPRDWDLEEAFSNPVALVEAQAFAQAKEARKLLLRRSRPTPRKVIVNLTYLCNNHCSFCAIGDRPRSHASTPAVLRALESHRARGYEIVDFDGGEPSLHPDLLTLMASAKRIGYERVTVVSNGRRLAYRNFARQLVRAGLDELLISLHAPGAELQDELTGVHGSFVQTTQGLRNALDCLGPQRVAVNSTLVAKNLDAMTDLGALLVSLGVQRWNIQLVTPFGRANESHVPNAAALSRTLSVLLPAFPAGFSINLVNCTPCLAPGFEHLASDDYAKSGRDMVFVGADGVNLQEFLATRRAPDERCSECLYSAVCPGHYIFRGELVMPRPRDSEDTGASRQLR